MTDPTPPPTPSPTQPWWHTLLMAAATALLTGAADAAGRAIGGRLQKKKDTEKKKGIAVFDRDNLRAVMATSPKMAEAMQDVDLMKLAKVPRLRVEDFTDEQCAAVVAWLESKADPPPVITSYLAPLKADAPEVSS